MVRPILLACGTRGDAEPFIALVSALVVRDDVECVKLLMPIQFVELAPSHDKLQVIGMEDMASGVGEAVSIDDPLARMGMYMAKYVLPTHIRGVEDAREMKADIVISGLPTLPLGVLIAAVLGVPLVFLQLQPLLPSAYYPQINRFPTDAANAFSSFPASDPRYKSGSESAAHAVLAPSVEVLREYAARYGVSTPNIDDLVTAFSGSAPSAHVLLAYPEVLAPRPPDAPPNASSIGSLAAYYIPENWKPSQQLENFVTKGDKPAILAFGSMPAPDGRVILSGLRSAGIKRILVVGSINGIEHDPSEGLYVARENVQYAWLFKHAEFVFCSGGAGTVASALAAGIPLIVAPVMMDQQFWAAAVELNPVGVHLREIAVNFITDAVERIRTSQITNAARVMASRSTCAQHAPVRAAEYITQACARR